MSRNYDVAAYIWPSYHEDQRALIFWPQGFGEWENVQSAMPRFEGHHQPRKPLWGYQNEADSRTMEMQIDAATDFGVNVFIYDWYWYDRRPFLEGCLDDGFLKARNNHKMKFFIMWANHDAEYLWDRRNSFAESTVWKGGVDHQEFKVVGTRLLEKYFGHPSYYTIDGKPVLSIYDLRTLVISLGGIDPCKEALAWLQREAENKGYPGIHLQLISRKNIAELISSALSSETVVGDDIIEYLGFDSSTHYQWAQLAVPDGDYYDWGCKAMKEWDVCADTYSVPYFPHVSIGWDNNPRFSSYHGPVIVNNPPDEFRKFLVRAKDYIDNRALPVPLVTINSWNEWTEASYLEPDKTYGYGYLQAVKDVFG